MVAFLFLHKKHMLYPQHMLSWRNKNNIYLDISLSGAMSFYSKCPKTLNSNRLSAARLWKSRAKMGWNVWKSRAKVGILVMKSRDILQVFSFRCRIQYANIVISEQQNSITVERKCQNKCSKKGIQTEAKLLTKSVAVLLRKAWFFFFFFYKHWVSEWGKWRKTL